jgi:predicted permease
VAIISYGYWQKRFGGNPAVLGKAVRMNNVPVTIVGVTPQDFSGIQTLQDPGADVTLPLALDPQLNPGRTPIRLKDGTNWWLQLVGRLKPGISPLQVRGNLEGAFQATAREGWASYLASLTPLEQALSFNQNHTAVPHLEVDSASGGIYPIGPNTLRSAWILSAVVGLMLLIVCANVANLLLSRASSRRREIAVRLALGATRSRLIRQLLTESLLLSCLGGILGILVGYWSRQLLPFARSAPLDWRVITFASLLCIITGIVFGMAPAMRATGVDMSGAMKESSRSLSRSRTLLSKSLLVVQVAISLAVLIGAGLFLKTLLNLRNVAVGFNTQNLVVFSIDPRINGYDSARARALYDQLHRYIIAIPGVRAVSHSGSALFDGGTGSTPMFIEGKPESAGPDDKGETIEALNVSPEFFETLEMPLLRGRNIEPLDALPHAAAVAVINEAAARKFFPNEDPLGKRFGSILEQAGHREIVGVVRDAKYDNLRDAVPPISFQPFVQTDFRASFEVRFSGTLPPLIQAIREAVQKADPDLPLVRITTQSDLLAGRLDQEHFFAMAYSLFGGLALLLTSIGLFGLMSHSVARRTNEIGIRMALGAERRDIVRMVLRESLILVAIGIAAGVATTLAIGRLIRTMLFGLAPTDMLTIGSAILTMLVVSTIASYFPARRASRIDPMTALHYD